MTLSFLLCVCIAVARNVRNRSAPLGWRAWSLASLFAVAWVALPEIAGAVLKPITIGSSGSWAWVTFGNITLHISNTLVAVLAMVLYLAYWGIGLLLFNHILGWAAIRYPSRKNRPPLPKVLPA